MASGHTEEERPQERPDRTSASPDPNEVTDDAETGDEISILRIVNVLLRHRRSVAAWTVGGALLVVAVALVLPGSYTSKASFTPQSDQPDVSQFAGLASQFGLSLPTGEMGESPQFYADLLESRKLLKETVVTNYKFIHEGKNEEVAGDLVALLEIDGDSRPVRVDRAIEEVRDEVTAVATNRETGVVELSVTTRWPELSRQVADRMIDLVNKFNVETRSSQAAAERRFVEEQLAEAQSDLRAAEDSLQQFLTENRSYQSSPQLRFQHQRLQRQVELHQQLYSSLSESYQQASIREVRNTPVITVVEPPEVPPRPDRRRLLFKGILGLLIGATVGTLGAFGRELMATTRQQEPDDYAEFERLKRETKDELRGLWRRVRGVFR